MLQKLVGSSGSVVGYRFSGTIDKADYAVLVPEMNRWLPSTAPFNCCAT